MFGRRLNSVTVTHEQHCLSTVSHRNTQHSESQHKLFGTTRLVVYFVSNYCFSDFAIALFSLSLNGKSSLVSIQHLETDLNIKLIVFSNAGNDKHENMCKKTTPLKSKPKTDDHLVFLRLSILVS